VELKDQIMHKIHNCTNTEHRFLWENILVFLRQDLLETLRVEVERANSCLKALHLAISYLEQLR
jgi:hypothetical protein